MMVYLDLTKDQRS